MHAAERETLILRLLSERGFIGFQELERRIDASPATLRRDLGRLVEAGRIDRVRGGARLRSGGDAVDTPGGAHLQGVPFHENIGRHPRAKAAIGRAAAELCRRGEAVIIDGGSTTLQMCAHLETLELQVLTNSLHIVSALLPQPGTRISIPGGTLFREQNIVLSAFEQDGTERFHATKMFMGAAAISRHGLMQNDVLLVQAERRLLSRTDELIVLVDSSKFAEPAGHVVCGLDEIHIIITDDGISEADAAAIEKAGPRLIRVPV
ncbi:MAG: DeoR/GlpR transcriptional regulator [Phenylobacterium sp.]|uniref:DeoR/GlpR family DNA-binding transcription regulator n=1 Tax=Phenylobacterium sp. TaxID=1871053 RepID=UPI00121FEECD|nr:DeoR/GlpR family DNA-binding transcription regulator [Phenylobacterium sp.]TAJ70176.1 MAG: DeoR/GlpR transcriptional regulator [Phenylobacterium sp.]